MNDFVIISNQPTNMTNGTGDNASGNGTNGSAGGHNNGTKDSSGEKDENDFSDYLWMENMEEYDEEVGEEKTKFGF